MVIQLGINECGRVCGVWTFFLKLEKLHENEEVLFWG
jgi:hypothetical protein